MLYHGQQYQRSGSSYRVEEHIDEMECDWSMAHAPRIGEGRIGKQERDWGRMEEEGWGRRFFLLVLLKVGGAWERERERKGLGRDSVLGSFYGFLLLGGQPWHTPVFERAGCLRWSSSLLLFFPAGASALFSSVSAEAWLSFFRRPVVEVSLFCFPGVRW